jgi:hypothetical protein
MSRLFAPADNRGSERKEFRLAQLDRCSQGRIETIGPMNDSARIAGHYRNRQTDLYKLGPLTLALLARVRKFTNARNPHQA